MCSLPLENSLLTSEGIRFASISKKTSLSKLSFAFDSLALPLLLCSILYYSLPGRDEGAGALDCVLYCICSLPEPR
jgi:hypothetical protein